jgi:hypothetical protein
MVQRDRRSQFIGEASKMWGKAKAKEMSEHLEKTADAVEDVEAYPLTPDDALKEWRGIET